MSWSSSSGSEEEDEGMDSYREGGYHAVRVGDTFSGGRYVAQRELGWGQFSTVWLAYDTQTSEYVVLKIQKSVPESALHEIQVLSTLTGFDPDNTEHVICLLEWSSTFDMGQSSHAPPLTPATIALPVIAARISRVDAQVQTVSRELTNVEDKTRATLVRIRRLEEDRNLIEEVIQLTRDELAATKARLHSLEERMTALEQRALAAEARATAAEARAKATEARATAAEQKAIEVTLAVSEMTERLSRHLGV